MLEKDIQEVLISEEMLQEKIKELGKQITAEYQGKEVLFLGILKGCIFFMCDLAKACDAYVSIDFITLCSYDPAATCSSGEVEEKISFTINPAGRHILVIEDIIDNGYTLDYLLGKLQTYQPASLKVCTLLDKPANRKKSVNIDYCGFVIPDFFVVGYGLDYNNHYRNLPFVGILKPEIYKEA